MIRFRDASITSQDLIWEEVNALGGIDEPNDPDLTAMHNCLVDQVLRIVEKHGGHDPAARRLSQMLRERAEGRAL